MPNSEQKPQKLAGAEVTDSFAHWSRISWWVAGVTLGVALVGPAWSGDALLNLDLVVFDRVSLSPGVWGLGPEIPRQSPIISLLAITSLVIDGTVLVVVLIVASVAGAFVGVARLSRPAPWHARVAGGTLYSLSPWLVTRMAVGHLGLAFAAALLPWVLPVLLRPEVSMRRTFLAAAAMGLGGYFGGSLALIVLAVGVVSARGHRGAQVAFVWVLSQLPWLVPGFIVALSAPKIAGGEFFGTALHSAGDVARLVFGFGFWQRGNQVALDSAAVPIAALVVFALALYGARRMPDSWGRRCAALAATGIFVATAGSIPLLGPAFDWFSTSLPGAIVREPQRVLVLFLVWLAPAAALGIGRLHAHSAASGFTASTCCVAIAVVTISPALWGVDGRLDGIDLPDSWSKVQHTIENAPGTTLALPWNQYIDVDVAEGRRTYHPVNALIRSDVLNASDPEFGPAINEAVDPRGPAIETALDRFDEGQNLSEHLDDIGVRWIVVVKGVDDERYGRLTSDDGFRIRLDDDSIALYEVLSWVGPGRSAAGEASDVDTLAPPLATAGDDAAVWFAPGVPGWMRGFEPARTTSAGAIGLPANGGPVWYWPALFVVIADLLTLSGVVVALRPQTLDRWRAPSRRIEVRSSDGLATEDDSAYDQ